MLPLQYGVVLTGGTLKEWQLACVRELDRSGLARLACIINQTPDAPSFASRSPSAAYDRFCRTLRLRSQATVDVSHLKQDGNDVVEIDVASSLGSAAKHQIRNLGLDYFLLFGQREFGIELVDAATYGVWYFAHSDITRFSSSAPCFWEVYYNHDVTGAMLVQLRDSEAACAILKSGYFPTIHESFGQNIEAVFSVLPQWPIRVCSDVRNGAADYFNDEPVPVAPLRFGNPSTLQIQALQWQQIKHRLARFVRERLYSIDWNVGRLNASPSDFIDRDVKADVDFLYPFAKGRFLADPFVFANGSRTFIFCEEYRYENRRGVVVVSELSAPLQARPQKVIEEPYHLSYPHVFEHDGAVYCIPEAGGTRQLSLYRSVDFPHRWEHFSTLLDDFEAADPTLVRLDSKWWLFCTSSEDCSKGYHSHLYIWHADDLCGKWTPHVKNPVKIDARSSRSAGPFFTHNRRLYRPAQDCSRGYGGLIRINRIDTLSESDFKETVVGVIRPPAKGYNKGIHTISSAGGWCIVDAKRYVFNPAGLTVALKLAVNDAALRLGVPKETLESLKRRLRKSGRQTIAIMAEDQVPSTPHAPP